MILVCPVRPGDDNEELRYALRSWETNLLYPDGLSLVTVGYKPSWLTPDVHIAGNRYPSPRHAVWDNVLLASHSLRQEARVVFMNDDFFCLDPMASILPVKRNQTLAEHCTQAKGSGWWGDSLDLTASWLSDQGYPSPDSYEVHRPLLAAPSAMLWALRAWDGGLAATIPQWRTVYGVLNQIEAHPVPDVKLSRATPGFGSPWVSTSDSSWRLHRQFITQRFQKRSRWEA